MSQQISSSYLTAAIATLDSCPNAAILFDINGYATHLNPAFLDRFHKLSGLKIGQSLHSHLSMTDGQRLTDYIKNLNANDTPTDTSFQLLASDLTLDIKPLHLGHNAPAGILGYVCEEPNIVEYEKNAFSQQSQRWQAALLSAHQAIWDVSIAAGLGANSDHHNFVSDLWFSMRGFAADSPEVNLKTWRERVHPNDLQEIDRVYEMQRCGALDDASYQYRYQHADGHWIWVLSRGRVISRHLDGSPARLVGTDTDITTFKENETALSEMASRLQMAIEASQMGVWEYHHDLKKSKWDSGIRKMYEITDGEEWRDANEWPRMLHPEDREKTMASLQDCLSNGTDVAVDYRIITKTGKLRHIRSLARQHRNSQKGDPRLLGVNIDMTDDVLKTQELEAARASLEYESLHDALTGLANRRALEQHHGRLFSNAPDGHPNLIVFHIDLDLFKQVNDQFGHAAGDALLVHVGSELRRIVGHAGLVSRHGGDEFVVIAPDTATINDAKAMANAMLTSFRTPFEWKGHHCQYGASIGIAQYSPKDANEKAVFVNADLALYAAKRAGRNCVRLYQPELRLNAELQRTNTTAIVDALNNGEITCLFQPQFDATSRRLVGFDAVPRWNSIMNGVLTEAQFISTLTAHNLMSEYDKTVLSVVLRHQRQWAATSGHVLPVSLNLSSQLFLDLTFPDRLKAFDFAGAKINFELADAYFNDTDDVVLLTNLAAIRDLGAQIHIKGFGAGNASILGLSQISPSRIKIDKRLTAHLPTSERNRQIVQSIIQIARICGAKTIVDGIASPDHAKTAESLGCSILQGYGLARAMDGKAAQMMLHDLSERDLGKRRLAY